MGRNTLSHLQKNLKWICRFSAFLLIFTLGAQHVLLCADAWAERPVNEAVDTLVVQNETEAPQKDFHTSGTNCGHPCHFSTTDVLDVALSENLHPEPFHAFREILSPKTAIHAVFHPPKTL